MSELKALLLSDEQQKMIDCAKNGKMFLWMRVSEVAKRRQYNIYVMLCLKTKEFFI